MPRDLMHDLADGTEFRLMLQARPPRVVHWSAWLSLAFLATALAWAGLTKADLVVRAPGRIRPISSPLPVRMAARGEVLSGSLGGQVVEVHATLGEQVRQGDLLVRLDTERLDSEMAKKKQTLDNLKREIVQLDHQEEELSQEVGEATKRAEAELAQAEELLRQKKVRQSSDVRIMERETERARGEMVQLQQLRDIKVATQVETDAARLKYLELREKLVQARLPVDEEPVEICRRALHVLQKQYAGKRRDLTLKKNSKEKESDEAQKDWESLRLERAHAEIRAPISGILTRGDIKVGTVLEPQQVIVEIAEQKGFLFEADVPNEEVGQLQVGLPVRIRLDPYDFQKYGILEGTVSFISPDSDLGEKSPAASYRVRIELAAEEVHHGENRGSVKLGMTGRADIVIEQERLLMLLVRKINRSISLR